MAREGHLYQAMIGNDLVGAAIVFPDETANSVYIGRIMDICLEHNGVGFEKTLYSDAGDDDKELVLNAKYRLCR